MTTDGEITCISLQAIVTYAILLMIWENLKNGGAMGGWGSGRNRGCGKPSSEGFHKWSMARLKELGVIGEPKNRQGSWQWTCNDEVMSSIGYDLNNFNPWDAWIRVFYRNKREDKAYDYKIRLSTTTPHYGGERWWFHCPAARCGRRVSVLYLGYIFACRHCHNIAYKSERQEAHERYTDRAFALAHKLGHVGNVIDGFYGERPKGMHKRTYQKQVAKLERYTNLGLSCFTGRYADFLF